MFQTEMNGLLNMKLRLLYTPGARQAIQEIVSR